MAEPEAFDDDLFWEINIKGMHRDELSRIKYYSRMVKPNAESESFFWN